MTISRRAVIIATVTGAAAVLTVGGAVATIEAESRPLGVRFVGVDTRDNRAAAQAFARRYRIGYPSIYDPDGKALVALGPLAPRAFPTTYLLDARHRIAAVYFGAIDYSRFKPAVLQVAPNDKPVSTNLLSRLGVGRWSRIPICSPCSDCTSSPMG